MSETRLENGLSCSTCSASIELQIDGHPPKFCHNCGSTLTLTLQDFSLASDVTLCPGCGAAVKLSVGGKTVTFCTTCGYRMVSTHQIKNQTDSVEDNVQPVSLRATLPSNTSTDQSVSQCASEVKVMDAREPLNQESKIDVGGPVLTKHNPYDANVVQESVVKASQITSLKYLSTLTAQPSSGVKSVNVERVPPEQAANLGKSSIRTHYMSKTSTVTDNIGNVTVITLPPKLPIVNIGGSAQQIVRSQRGMSSLTQPTVMVSGVVHQSSLQASIPSLDTGNNRKVGTSEQPIQSSEASTIQRNDYNQSLSNKTTQHDLEVIFQSPTVAYAKILPKPSLQGRNDQVSLAGSNRKVNVISEKNPLSNRSHPPSQLSPDPLTPAPHKHALFPSESVSNPRSSGLDDTLLLDRPKTVVRSASTRPSLKTQELYTYVLDKFGNVQRVVDKGQLCQGLPQTHAKHKLDNPQINIENYNGCSLPILTHITPNHTDKLSATDKSSSSGERTKTSTISTDVKMEVLDIEHVTTAMNGRATMATDSLQPVSDFKNDGIYTMEVSNDDSSAEVLGDSTDGAVKRESYDDIADIPYKLIHVADEIPVVQHSLSEAPHSLLLLSDEHDSVQRDDASFNCTVPDDDMDGSDSPTKQEMIEEEVTVRQISEYCVVCNFHPGSDQLLAQHYTDEHTTPILQVFNVSHLYKSSKPIHSSSTPLESQTSYPTYKNFLTSTDPSSLHLKAQELTHSVIHCGAHECGMGFVSYVDWKIHQQDKHQDSDALCKCQDCGVAMCYDELISHLEGENRCIRCYNCKAITKASHFGVHLQKCDLASLSLGAAFTVCFRCGAMGTCACDALKCNQCGKLCYGERGLRQHRARCIRKSAEQSQFLYRCPLCEYRHRLSWHLDKHMKTHLDETMIAADCSLPWYKCTICTVWHRKKSGLYKHVVKVHFRPNKIDYCLICDLQMDSLTAGWNHVLSHQSDGRPDIPASQKSYQCRFCDRSMKNLTALKQHAAKHKIEVSYQSSDPEGTVGSCDKCGFEYRSHCQGIYHTTTTHQPVINCILCEASFGYVLDLQCHLQEVHGTLINGSANVSCRLCDKEMEVKNVSDAVSHAVKQHGDSLDEGRIASVNTCKCGLCKSLMPTVQDYITHGCISASLIKCVICFKQFDTREELSDHITIVHIKGSGRRLITCKSCNRVFDTKDQMSNHTRDIHGGEANCHICFAPFKTVNRCIEHAETHFPNSAEGESTCPAKTQKCLFCLKVMESLEQSKEHVRAHYEPSLTKVSKKRCYDCSETLINAADAMRHSRIHLKEKGESGSRMSHNCAVCMLDYHDEIEELEVHTKTHFGKNKELRTMYVKCLECPYEAKTTRALRTHYRKLHNASFEKSSERNVSADSLFKCDYCKRVFLTKYRLKAHVKNSHGKEMSLSTVNCHICFSAFKSVKECLEHSEEHYSDISEDTFKEYTCQYCKKALPTKETSFEHAKAHYEQVILECSICLGELCNGSDAMNHIILHQTNDKVGFQCVICESTAATQNSLQDHMESHFRSEITLKCLECEFVSASTRRLLYHYKKTHPIGRQSCEDSDSVFKCDECEVQVESSCRLQFHRTSKHSSSIICVLCQSSFAYVQELKLHWMKEHSFDDAIACKLCGEKLSGPDECIEHTKSNHTEDINLKRLHVVKPDICGICFTPMKQVCDYMSHGEMSHNVFKCVICFEEYGERDGLRDHLIAHYSGDHNSLFKCDSCERVFRYKSGLKSHVTKIHGKGINCQICFSSFKSMTECLQHIEEHYYNISEDILKEYTCQYCKKALPSKETSIEHAKAHYELLIVECRICLGELSNDSDAMKHIIMHQTEDKVGFHCIICETTADTQSRLQDHMKSHFRSKIAVNCLECDFVSASNRGLLHHYKKTHLIRKQTFTSSVCDICEKDFKSTDKIKRHLQSSKGQQKYECEICNFKCHLKLELNDHILLNHLGDGPFTCSHCDKVLKTKELLIAHLKNVEKLSSCQICGKSVSNLARHMKFKHIENARDCQICGKSVSNLARHMKFKHIENARDCHICGKSTSYLADHLKKKHSDRACGHCEYVTNISDRDLEDHVRANHIEHLTCEVCDMVYDTEVQLEAHLAVYSTMPIYTCELCEFRTHYRQIVVEEHMHAIHGRAMPTETHVMSAEGLPFHCSFCPEKFETSDLVNTHINSLHKNELGSWECHSCKVKFRLKAFLLNHQIAVHNKARAFSCETCSAMFHTQSRLNRHIRLVHESSRIYNCELCEKIFKRKDHLTQHIHVVHEGNKYWYRCQQCGVKFPQKSDVWKHTEAEHMPIELTVEAHTETRGRRQKKSHQCDQCDEVFALRSSLAEHEADVHQQESDEDSDNESVSDVDDDSNSEWEGDANDNSADSEWEVADDSDDSDYIS